MTLFLVFSVAKNYTKIHYVNPLSRPINKMPYIDTFHGAVYVTICSKTVVVVLITNVIMIINAQAPPPSHWQISQLCFNYTR